MSIETLLEQCRAGDELAWEALVRRTQGRVYSLAYHYLRDREEARDVAQEAFVRIYRNLDRYQEGGSFMAWMARITRNCALDRLRRLKVLPAYGGDPVDEGDQHADGEPDPEVATLSRERSALLYRALDRMSEINREMVLLKEIQGLKQSEIAEMLDLPLGTVKARTNRARLELAARVLELDPSYGA